MSSRGGSSRRWRPGPSTRSSRPLREQEGALAVLHGHAQHQKMPGHDTSPSLASRQRREAWLRRSRNWVPDASSRENGGPRLEPARAAGTRARSPRRSAASRTADPTTRAGGIRRGAEPVSRCLVRTESLAANDRTATEARVRFPSGVISFQAEPERWSGIRTRDPMIGSHLLYPSELSSFGATDRSRTGDLRVPPALYQLSYDHFLVQRNTKPQSGPRQPGLHEPGPKAERRARGYAGR